MKKELIKIPNGYYYPWSLRYPGNFVKNAITFIYSFKIKHNRAKYGVTNHDAFNLDCYLLDVISNGLHIIKKANAGHPVELTEEEWNNVLSRMKELVEIIRVDSTDCEKADKIYENRFNSNTWTKEVQTEWINAIEEYEELRQESLEELCDLMKEYFFNLYW